ncbi:MAG: DNA starvation/stationary phase protection protein [Leptospiraceae bacterium]|nr:DNA starvation/stationary phase protection protein [Leptospiraceae bacterium]MCB1302738.1 DNA starvation/stationary phase protection protein [Leptospiraceae bacterium]
MNVASMNTGIPESDRAQIVEGLKRVLADTYTLYLKTHNYHWNVTGPMFDTLHRMFMEQYNELWTSVDEIAERIRALGHYAPGSYKAFADLTSIAEDKEVPPAKEMIANLVEAQEATIRTLREVFPAAESGNDEATVDLLTQRLHVHEKTAWMLRSLLA